MGSWNFRLHIQIAINFLYRHEVNLQRSMFQIYHLMDLMRETLMASRHIPPTFSLDLQPVRIRPHAHHPAFINFRRNAAACRHVRVSRVYEELRAMCEFWEWNWKRKWVLIFQGDFAGCLEDLVSSLSNKQ